MSYCQSVCPTTNVYNAVKIKINNPSAEIPNKIKTQDGDMEFNAVSLEVNNPKVAQQSVYSYPKHDNIITYDMANLAPLSMLEMPIIPVAYKTSFINNQTYISTDFEEKETKIPQTTKADEKLPVIEEFSVVEVIPAPETIQIPEDIQVSDVGIEPEDIRVIEEVQIFEDIEEEPESIQTTDGVRVPEPYLTNVENEKGLPISDISFNGISFKAKPEIVPSANVKPAVNTEKVIENLESSDYDIQAKQLEEIVSSILKDSKMAIPFITTSVFSKMIDIAEKDTSSLAGPTEEQIEIRKKIITNEIVRSQQLAENKKPEEIKLPYEITKEEFIKATELSDIELAERNKEYALLTLAALTKAYAEEYEKKTGNVIPLTDLPGASSMVEALKKSKNSSVKIAAIEALVYINRAEYKNEISAILKVAAEDNNKAVAMVASDALKSI